MLEQRRRSSTRSFRASASPSAPSASPGCRWRRASCWESARRARSPPTGCPRCWAAAGRARHVVAVRPAHRRRAGAHRRGPVCRHADRGAAGRARDSRRPAAACHRRRAADAPAPLLRPQTEEPRPGSRWLFWAAQGFGMLLNALAVPILSLSTIIALARLRSELRLAQAPAPVDRHPADADHRRAVASRARPHRWRRAVLGPHLARADPRAGRRSRHEMEGRAVHLHVWRSCSASCPARSCWCRR